MIETIKKVLRKTPKLYAICSRIYNMKKPSEPQHQTEPEPQLIDIRHDGRKILYFDITTQAATSAKTGIQRVVANFIKYLKDVIDEEYDIVAVSGSNGYKPIDIYDYRPYVDRTINPKPGDIFLSIDLNPEQQCEYSTTLKEWQKNGCKIYACLYDIGFEIHPEFVADKNVVTIFSRWLYNSASYYDGILCISKTVEQELKEYILTQKIKNDKLKTDYFYLGADFTDDKDDNQQSLSALMEKTNKHKALNFLAVSTIEPRKGYLDMLIAFEHALETGIDCNLIIVGRIGWKYEETINRIKQSKYNSKNIFWLSNCDDDMLSIMYQISDCFISASYYEGFGLGIIEASLNGLPRLLRDIPINKEVSGGEAVFFKDVEDLKDKFIDIYNDPSIITKQKMLKVLTWKQSVKMAWDKIEHMIQES